MFGWDFCFEFTYDIKNKYKNIIDSHEKFSFKVQSKGFYSDYQSYSGRQITLRNINHMIQSKEPWVFIFTQTEDEVFYIVFLMIQ